MRFLRHLLTLWIVIVLACAARAQKFDNFGRDRAREILRNIAEDIKKHYYDPDFHGVDFDQRVRDADEKLRQSTSVTEAYKLIAWAIQGLNDLGTFFLPPSSHFSVDYGWQIQMFGDHCYVTRVRPKSDAEAKGLKPGDEVVSVNGVKVTPASIGRLAYIIGILSPQPELHMQIRGIADGERQLVVQAKVDQLKEIRPGTLWAEAKDTLVSFDKLAKKNRPRCESVDELAICKMPLHHLENQQTEAKEVRDLLAFAQKHQGLILDLRGAGGDLAVLEVFTGGIFDHEFKIGDWVSRGGTRPQMAKPQHDHFTGKLVVLLDSDSSSASEILARTVQLQKRGTVLGDRSAGSVRTSKFYWYHFKTSDVLDSYEASITDADFLMPDGQSLEGKGVIPDELLLPARDDLATGNDPVLARAAELAGVKLTPENAGKLFPWEWPKE